MLNFKNLRISFLLLGLFTLSEMPLFGMETPPVLFGGRQPRQYANGQGYYPPNYEENVQSKVLGDQLNSLRASYDIAFEKWARESNADLKGLYKTRLDKIGAEISELEPIFKENLNKKPTQTQRAWYAFLAPTSLNGIVGLGPLEVGLFIIGSILLAPFIETSKTFVTTLFKDRIWVAFEGFVGGLTTKTIRTTIHCQQLFKSTRDLIALVMRLSAREVGAGMDTRIRVPNGQTAADKDAQKPSETVAQETYKCPICQRSDGSMEFFFDCKGGVDHGMHPECAIKFFASAGDKNCPACKAERKFDVMSPDVVIASMIDKLNIKSELQSHILILKAAQKKINGLIKQMSKCHDKNKYLTERTMLLAVSMDISRLIDLLKKIICQNDFFNQENLKKLDVCAAVGDFNCQTLLKYIKGSRDDVSGLRRDGIGSGYSGSGLGNGFGSGLGSSGF